MTTPVSADDAAPIVRQVERADLVAIHRIERASFPQPWPYAAFERYLDEPGFLVAERTADGDPTAPAAGAGAGARARAGAGAGVGDGNADADADGGDLIGYVVADAVPHHEAPLGHVKDIAVAPDERGAGVGSTLLERAVSVLADRGAGSIKLEVRAGNERARSLYREHGFEHRRTIPDYYGNDEDALVMVRTLE